MQSAAWNAARSLGSLRTERALAWRAQAKAVWRFTGLVSIALTSQDMAARVATLVLPLNFGG